MRRKGTYSQDLSVAINPVHDGNGIEGFSAAAGNIESVQLRLHRPSGGRPTENTRGRQAIERWQSYLLYLSSLLVSPVPGIDPSLIRSKARRKAV